MINTTKFIQKILGIEEEWTLVNLTGTVAVVFDVFVDMDVSAENPVVKAPVELGSFVAFNKTSNPTQIGLKLALKGDGATLQESLNNLFTLASGTDLVSVITPEREYRSYNIEKLQYSRTVEHGTDIIYVDLGLSEVREVVAEYAADTIIKEQNTGSKQGEEVDPKTWESWASRGKGYLGL